MEKHLYCLPEEIRGKDYITASYYLRLPKDMDVMKKARALAIGQTIGTWTAVPGITEELKEKHMGRIVQIFDVPAVDLFTQITGEWREYVVQIGYPTCNLTPDFPLLITSLLGNDASTSLQVKLLDIEFPPQFVQQFHGPGFGMEGIRKWSQVEGRPLLLNMIKPCTGLTPEEGAKIFYQTALGKVDLIKDDELLGSPEYSKAWERVKAFKKAAQMAYQETGRTVRYIVNITDSTEHIEEVIDRVVAEGADALMVNFAAVGYSTVHWMAGKYNLPILAHCAGGGMFCEGINSGMSSPLALGKLIRMAGADMVMVNTPYGGYPMAHQKYLQLILQLTLPYYGIKSTMPVIGGGVHPGMIARYIEEAGTDIILAAGGAIQGHPGGAAKGADAMMQAIEAITGGSSLFEASRQYPELEQALQLWGEAG